MAGLAVIVILTQVLLAVVNILAGEDKREKGEHYGFNYFAAGVCIGAVISVVISVLVEQ